MTRIVQNFLKDEEHAAKVIIDGSMVLMTLSLVVALAAILFMN